MCRKKSFDIVIGNPSYIGESGNKALFRKIAGTEFGSRFYSVKMDLFYYFFHLGIEIARWKGIIALIRTHYFTTVDSGNKLRRDIREKCTIHRMIDFNEVKVFASAKGQHNMITFLQKGKDEEAAAYRSVVKKSDNTDREKLRSIMHGWRKDVVHAFKRQGDLFDRYGHISS
ncbi:Eco57I restriction-modification methylase domain-containing protein [Geosporobacter subterraneus]|uniref:Eco57I restriction-modification methylase domain-containing protein n=1 Tax=Geosporobacter subterraneus TaxID=390806 RepID=UPI000DA63999|nr:Eco57I restriction-modification methylase domain-containing protein [Geosporobacter subterraneus]